MSTASKEHGNLALINATQNFPMIEKGRNISQKQAIFNYSFQRFRECFGRIQCVVFREKTLMQAKSLPKNIKRITLRLHS